MFHLHGLPGSLDRSTGVTPFPRTAGRIILLMLGVPWLIQRYPDSSRESAQRLGDSGHSELLPASTVERNRVLAISSIPPSCCSSSVKTTGEEPNGKNACLISLKIAFLHFSWSLANQAIVCCSSKMNKY